MKTQRNRGWSVLSILVLLGLLLGSCGPAAPTPAPSPTPVPTPKPLIALPTPTLAVASPTPAPVPTPAPAAAGPRYGGIFIIGQAADPPGFDPHQEAAGTVSWLIVSTYDRLIRWNPLDPNWREIVPGLAEKWELSADGLVYTFHLRQGVQWHDGQPFTAEDAAYSLMRIAYPPKGVVSARKTDLGAIDRAEATDKNTLKVTLKYPSASFLPFLAGAWMLMVPKHILEKEGQAALRSKVVGTGPFRFKEYMRGVSYGAVKNPDYFRKGRPYLDGFTHFIIRDPAARLAAFRTRQIMYIPIVPGILTTEAAVLKRELGNNIEVQSGSVMTIDVIAMNMKRKPLDDVRVRQAISLALEREVYFKLAYQGLGEVSGWMLGSGQWGLPKEELAKLPGYGPDMKARMAEAKKLLAEAGYPDGFKTTAMSNVATRSTQGLEWAVSVLPAIGIKVDMRPVERAVEDSLAIQGAFDMYAKGFLIAIDDPDAVFGPHLITESGRNYWQYSNPEIDRLYAEQTRTLDREKRRKIVDEMHKIVLREVPVAIMGYQGLNLVTWAEVKNVFFPRGTVSHSAADISEGWLAK